MVNSIEVTIIAIDFVFGLVAFSKSVAIYNQNNSFPVNGILDN